MSFSYSDLNHIVPSYNRAALDNAVFEHIDQERRHKNRAYDSTNFLAEQQRANLASEFAKQILKRVIEFDQKLDIDHEVGMQLVTFGQATIIHVSDVGCCNPSLILFIGYTNEKAKVELIQHVSQINFLLVVLPKLDPDKPKRKIGYVQPN